MHTHMLCPIGTMAVTRTKQKEALHFSLILTSSALDHQLCCITGIQWLVTEMLFWLEPDYMSSPSPSLPPVCPPPLRPTHPPSLSPALSVCVPPLHCSCILFQVPLYLCQGGSKSVLLLTHSLSAQVVNFYSNGMFLSYSLSCAYSKNGN